MYEVNLMTFKFPPGHAHINTALDRNDKYGKINKIFQQSRSPTDLWQIYVIYIYKILTKECPKNGGMAEGMSKKGWNANW